MKWAGILILGLVGLLLLASFLLWRSARANLDCDRAHSRATEKLPVFGPDVTEGLARIPANGLEFRSRIAGFGRDGDALILLHGFPETSIMWEPLIERAAAAGFRVVAYDQRGFSPGARPTDIDAYHVDRLVEDLHAIADAVGFERFHLIGHDWGSLVGWIAAASSPERILSWASLSIPHPAAISPPDAKPTTPLYIRMFRLPGFAETLLGAGGRAIMHRAMWASMPEAHRTEYESVFSEPGALTAALGLYRAMNPARPPESAYRPIRQPVLYVYGRHDIATFVNPDVQARLPALVEGPLETVALEAGHWLIQDEEAVVVDHLMRHLAGVR